ncbi:MAG: DUF2726 domain-containing protein [Betaproteobacteria bacterium]
MLGYVLLTLLPVAAVAYLAWFYRKKHAERAAASSKRFADMFGPVTPSRTSVPEAVAAQPAPASTAAPSAALCLPKEKLLAAQHATFFHALVAALPEHRVFPAVSLGSVVDLPPAVQGREREQRRRGLAQATLDFLICDEHTRPITAIDLRESVAAEDQFKSEYLKAARLRYLRISPTAAPEGAALRSLVLAEPAGAVRAH